MINLGLTKTYFDSKFAAIYEIITDSAVEGFGPFCSASDLADIYKQKTDNIDKAISLLIKNELLKIGATSVLTQISKFPFLPLAIPLNIAANYFIVARVVAVIAKLKGRNLNDKSVRRFIMLCLLTSQSKELIKMSKMSSVKLRNMMIASFIKRRFKFFPLLKFTLNSTVDCAFLLSAASLAKKVL